MEVKIGVQNVARELSIETDESAEQVAKSVRDAINGGGVLTLTDNKGREVIVPAAALAYIQVGEAEKSRVGFGTVPVPR